jgi:methionine synthase II (cobalamin-independent)
MSKHDTATILSQSMRELEAACAKVIGPRTLALIRQLNDRAENEWVQDASLRGFQERIDLMQQLLAGKCE